MLYLSSLILAFCLATSCNQEPTPQVIAGYDLQDPAQIIALNAELSEISGLTYYAGLLLAVQDERGRVYQIDPQTGEMVHDEKFWDKGDFEGIEDIGSDIIALKSNGNLYQFDPKDPDEDTTIKIDLGFPGGSNFEGLGYDRSTRQLILTAKRTPKDVKKEVYAVDLQMEEAPEPVMVLDQKELLQKLSKGKKKGLAGVRNTLVLANYSFNPSAVAVHPQTGDRFILSSPMPQLLVLSDRWKIKDIILLDKLVFRQPESICFDPAGNLYIANEGQGGRGTILKFERQ